MYSCTIELGEVLQLVTYSFIFILYKIFPYNKVLKMCREAIIDGSIIKVNRRDAWLECSNTASCDYKRNILITKDK